jgi:hypothetical protein
LATIKLVRQIKIKSKIMKMPVSLRGAPVLIHPGVRADFVHQVSLWTDQLGFMGVKLRL